MPAAEQVSYVFNCVKHEIVATQTRFRIARVHGVRAPTGQCALRPSILGYSDVCRSQGSIRRSAGGVISRWLLTRP